MNINEPLTFGLPASPLEWQGTTSFPRRPSTTPASTQGDIRSRLVRHIPNRITARSSHCLRVREAHPRKIKNVIPLT